MHLKKEENAILQVKKLYFWRTNHLTTTLYVHETDLIDMRYAARLEQYGTCR